MWNTEHTLCCSSVRNAQDLWQAACRTLCHHSTQGSQHIHNCGRLQLSSHVFLQDVGSSNEVLDDGQQTSRESTRQEFKTGRTALQEQQVPGIAVQAAHSI